MNTCRPKLAIPIVALSILGTSAPAALADTGFRLRGELTAEYTDNLFHYSDARLLDFDIENGPGERFEGLDSESDLVGRARLRADYRWQVAKKREFGVSFGGSWFSHAENGEADYGEVEGGVHFDVTRRDRLSLTVDQTIDRFKKNYRIANTTQFAPASYDQTDTSLTYERKLGDEKRVQLELAAGARQRRFNATFDSRDLDGKYLGAGLAYRLSRRIDAESSIRFGDVESGTEVDAAILLDRSYDELVVTQAFDFELQKRLHLDVELRLRRRDFSTGVEADLGRFERNDDNKRLRVALEKSWKNGMSFAVTGTLIDNDSDRIDPSVEIDEAGYQEAVIGLGFGFEF